MSVLNGTDLAALHAAILSAAAAAFPGVHFEFYRDDRTNLPFGDGAAGNDPRAYVLMELDEFEPSDAVDPGTEQLAMMAKFSANVIMKTLPVDARLSVRVLAAAFAAFLRKQSRFSPSTVLQGSTEVVGCYKDDFNQELDKYEVWRVDWVQNVWLGIGDVWLPEPGATPPDQVFFSFAPLIGASHETDYKVLP